ncbi:hypothetical protein BDB00DRAFT_792035 [Zychaea mexicana]|uniref:uncharacterized protein n=1 Tax=Zychaea mexicana TaxID=64656 RepID=UPI0022FE9253|nr:uncharacterized protein BDB00DRAFT_792035 [Zychaea mexicana]KAI9488190.1 hypothetical protein BDB00DRAFT_792035 [Zychaea mexicana]
MTTGWLGTKDSKGQWLRCRPDTIGQTTLRQSVAISCPVKCANSLAPKIHQFGVPSRAFVDGGPHFASGIIITSFRPNYGIKLELGPPHHSHRQGKGSSHNQELRKHLNWVRLAPHWLGPFHAHEVLGKNIYRLRDGHSTMTHQVHADQLKLYTHRPKPHPSYQALQRPKLQENDNTVKMVTSRAVGVPIWRVLGGVRNRLPEHKPPRQPTRMSIPGASTETILPFSN